MTAAITSRLESLLSHGIATIPFPQSHDLALEAMHGFRRFLDDPSRDRFTINRGHCPVASDPDGQPDDGYLPKRGESRAVLGGQYDKKDLFHWSPQLRSLLAARGIDTEDHEQFFQSCATLQCAADAVLSGTFSELDELLPGFRFREAFDSCDRRVLRLIQYFPGEDDRPIIGKGHHDRNWFTLHLAENRPGLLIGSDERLVSLERDSSFLFAGPKTERHTQGRIRGLWHAIRDERPLDPPRWSVVYFVHLKPPLAS